MKKKLFLTYVISRVKRLCRTNLRTLIRPCHKKLILYVKLTRISKRQTNWLKRFSVPREPKNTTITTTFDEKTINITGDSTEIEASSGLLDKYKVHSLSPNHGSNDGPVTKNASLTLSDLTPGTEYTIQLKTEIDGCGGVTSTNFTQIVQCTSNLLFSIFLLGFLVGFLSAAVKLIILTVFVVKIL